MQLSILKSRDETGNALNQAPGSLVDTERERNWAHSSSFPAPSSRQSAARAALTAFRNFCLQATVGPTLASVWGCCGCFGEACPLSPHPEELRRHRIRGETGEPNSPSIWLLCSSVRQRCLLTGCVCLFVFP